MKNLHIRPRRNRKSENIRKLNNETILTSSDLVYPIFIQEGTNKKTEIESMPNIYRLSIDLLIAECKEIEELKIPAICLFPLVPNNKKSSCAKESFNESNLICTAIKEVKKYCPNLVVISDVALDPYSSEGHDGIVKNNEIINDETVEILCKQALVQAAAGADIVAPSDMMDGRIGEIRKHLDSNGFENTSILSYSAKYASAFYAPFRDALDSAPAHGDKKTYQMDPSNSKEALKEVDLDISEGADFVMIKPGTFYLDIVQKVSSAVNCPVAVYQVSGEYTMLHTLATTCNSDIEELFLESLIAFKRAGAQIIFTYAAKLIARKLSS